MLVTTTGCINVLLYGGHAIRNGIKLILLKQKRLPLTIVAETEDVHELKPLIKKHKPCVTVAILFNTELDHFIKQFIRKGVQEPIVILTESNDQKTAFALLNIGVKGILHRTCTCTELVSAVAAAHRGEHYHCPHIARQLVCSLMKERNELPGKIQLSKTEIKIIRMICGQKTTMEISKVIGVSTRTIDAHRYKIQKKTETKNIAGIVMYAVRSGLVSEE